MSYHDRGYSRGSRSGDGGDGGWDPPAYRGNVFQQILHWLNWSFAIGYVAGIRVRVHITFVLLLFFRLLQQGDVVGTLRWSALLFVSVLLHEFGHALACRAVGGSANDILMWPLGGLAFCAPPQRPWPEFVTVVCGPLVNLVLAAGGYLALWLMFNAIVPLSLHPFDIRWQYLAVLPDNPWARLIADLMAVNYSLLLFNLALVFFPFDGGRLVQIALWKFVGYQTSLRWATAFGIVGAAIVAVFGMTANDTWLVVIAIFGFYACWQQRRQVQNEDPYGLGFAPSYDPTGAGAEPDRPGWLARRREARQQRDVERRSAQQRRHSEQVDRILDKIHREGLGSLTANERQILQEVSDRKK
jgi:stage IV sporulation protein FB